MLRKTERVRVKFDVDLLPHAILNAGEYGTVVRTYDDAQGVWAVDVLMDKFHKGLIEWDNEAHLTFPELEGLEEVTGPSSGNPKHTASIAACLLAWVMYLPQNLWTT